MRKKILMILVGIAILITFILLNRFQYISLLSRLNLVAYMAICIIMFGALMFYVLSLITDDNKDETKRKE